MEKMKICSWSWLGLVLVWAMLVCECQAQDTSCLGRLAPCLKYLNGTRDPPSSCCDPLKSVIESNPQCLCSMVSSRGSSEATQAGFNITEAQELPGRCGQNVNPIACLAGSPRGANNRVVPNGAASRFGSVWSMDPMVLLVAVALSATLQIIWASNNT